MPLSQRIRCTECGRQVPYDETAEVTIRRSEEAIVREVRCALHTEHEANRAAHVPTEKEASNEYDSE